MPLNVPALYSLSLRGERLSTLITVPDVSIIVINYNTRDLLLGCLNSIYSKAKHPECTVTVVDNGSSDGSIQAIREYYPSVSVISNERNLGFAGAVNQAVKDNPAKYVFILNSDTVLTDGALAGLVEFMDKNPKAGIVTGQFLHQDGSPQHSFDNFPDIWMELFGKGLLRRVLPGKYPSKHQVYQRPTEVPSVIGAAMLVRTEAVRDVGLLDEDYFLFLEETDWCCRMRRKGWQVFIIPAVNIYHLQGKTKGIVLIPAKIEYLNSLYKFYRKHYSPVIYAVLRLIRPIKILLGFSINLTGMVLTLGLIRKLRKRAVVYGALLGWHLALCPKRMTLRYKALQAK